VGDAEADLDPVFIDRDVLGATHLPLAAAAEGQQGQVVHVVLIERRRCRSADVDGLSPEPEACASPGTSRLK